MTGKRWPLEDSVGAGPTYFSCGARRQSQSCLSLACAVDCWHVARLAGGVPNMIVFHDDIGAFLLVFSQFPTNKSVKLSSS
jgi:hypothetical protein